MSTIECKFIGPIAPMGPLVPPQLSQQEVCVWFLRLSLVSDEKMAPLFTPAEAEKAALYRRKEDGSRFLKSRALVKLLIASYLNLNIADIIIANGVNKKPALSADKGLHFNISHSGDLTAIAISYSPVGIDVEQVGDNYKYKDVLNLCFNQDEITFIDNTGYAGFYKLWTMKEAIVKCTAKGIDNDLPNIPSLEGTHTVTEIITGQSLQAQSFEPIKDYVGSVAFINDVNKLTFFDAYNFLAQYHC